MLHNYLKLEFCKWLLSPPCEGVDWVLEDSGRILRWLAASGYFPLLVRRWTVFEKIHEELCGS